MAKPGLRPPSTCSLILSCSGTLHLLLQSCKHLAKGVVVADGCSASCVRSGVKVLSPVPHEQSNRRSQARLRKTSSCEHSA